MCRRARGFPIAHSHDAYEETIYGLRGVASWTVEGDVPTSVPASAVIPRGAVHRFDNNGDEDATMLAIVTPGLLGPDYFHELAAVVEAAAGGPPDPEEIVAVMLRHGLDARALRFAAGGSAEQLIEPTGQACPSTDGPDREERAGDVRRRALSRVVPDRQPLTFGGEDRLGGNREARQPH